MFPFGAQECVTDEVRPDVETLRREFRPRVRQAHGRGSQEGYQSFAAGYAKEALSTLHKHLETAQALTAAATTGKR